MLTEIFIGLCRLSPRVKQHSWRHWYQYLARRHRRADWRFMNFGYVPLDPALEPLELEADDEAERTCAQLYNHIAGAIDLTGLDVLEVGSGRGGGSDFILRYLGPRAMTGVDLAPAAIDFCHRIYDQKGLSFRIGDASALPFEDQAFDVVLNVESSHCYASVDDFFKQVRRVLRPGGRFLFADLRYADQLDELNEQIERSGLELLHEEDITPNVTRALELDAERRAALITSSTTGPLLKPLKEFAGVKGSMVYHELLSGKVVYPSFILRKE